MTATFQPPGNREQVPDHPAPAPVAIEEPPSRGVGLLGVLATGIGFLVLASLIFGLLNQFMTPEGDPRLLVIDESQTVWLTAPEDGEVLATMPRALAAADGSLVFRLVEEEGRALIQEIDPAKGTVLDTRFAGPAPLQLRAVAPHGEAVALMPPSDGQGELSEVVVVRRGERDPRRFLLSGTYLPQTFSADASSLYLVELLGPEGERRRLHRLEMVSGRFSPVFDPRFTLSGSPTDATVSPDSGSHLSVYVRDEPVVAGVGGPASAHHAELVMIDLLDAVARRVLLPAPLGAVGGELAVDADPAGDSVYVFDPAAGWLAVIDAGQGTTVGLVAIPRPSPEAAPPALAASAGGVAYLAAGDEVLRVDLTEGTTTVLWQGDAVIHDLHLAPDEETLRVALDGQVVAVSVADGTALAGVALPTSSATLVGPPQPGRVTLASR